MKKLIKKIWSLIKFCFYCAVALLIYTVCVEPYMLEATPYVVENHALSGVKIVFATDFHVGPYPWEKWRLQRIVRKINEQNPDLVLLGGDYVRGHEKSSTMTPQEIAAALQQINAPKVAVLGNHDSYYGKEEVEQALTSAGITVLSNSNVRMRVKNKWVTIAGVRDAITDTPLVEDALADSEPPVIFLTHDPDVFEQIKGHAAIAFAGHTHGGQIVVPFMDKSVFTIINPEFVQKYRYGLFYDKSSLLLVSSGLGTSILPMRFNSRPEIVSVTFEGFFRYFY